MNFLDKMKLALEGNSTKTIKELEKKAKLFRRKDYSDDLLEELK